MGGGLMVKKMLVSKETSHKKVYAPINMVPDTPAAPEGEVRVAPHVRRAPRKGGMLDRLRAKPKEDTADAEAFAESLKRK
jgi:hypothetical protein